MSDLIAAAWDAVKGEGDASYGASHSVLKAELKDRADAIIKTGATNKSLMGGEDLWAVYDRFEAKFLELHKADAEASKHGDVPADAEFVATIEGARLSAEDAGENAQEKAEGDSRIINLSADGVDLNELDEDVIIDISNEGHADEKPLDKMSRAELDEIAEKEFGFNPSDFSNKAEIVEAIEQARN